MVVILEEHELLAIAENLQDAGLFNIEHKDTEAVALAIAHLIQERLDDLINPDELTHLLSRRSLAQAFAALPMSEEEEELDLAA